MFLHVKKKKKIPRTESKTFLAREKNIFKNVFTDPPKNLITLEFFRVDFFFHVKASSFIFFPLNSTDKINILI